MVTLFSDTLETSRDYLETGEKVVVTVEATLEADQLKLLGRSVAPIDSSLAGAGAMGLRIFVENATAVTSVASVLAQTKSQGIKAQVRSSSVCWISHCRRGHHHAGEDFPLNPQIKGAKSLEGVLQVEDLAPLSFLGL